MKDKRIKVADNSMVFFDDKILGIDGENLQGKIIFYFNNFKDGVAWLEFEKGDRTKGYIPLNKVNETYELEIKSSLLSDTKRIWMQLRITQDENIKGIPVFKSNKFFMDVLDSINATSTIQEEYPNILDVVNTKQDKLVAGANITIDGNVISATGSGGTGGTSNYNDSRNKPQINGVTLVGNKTTKELGIEAGKEVHIGAEEPTGEETIWIDPTEELDKITKEYNVKDYGAVGDGVADDTEAFRKCINEANGNQVIVPDGNYAVNHLEIDDGISINMIGINRPTIIRTKVQDLNPNRADYRAMFLFRNVKFAKFSGINFDSKRDNFICKTGTTIEYIDYMNEIEYKGNFYFNKNNNYHKVISADYEGALVKVQPGEKYKITGRTTSYASLVAFFSDYSYVEGTAVGETKTFVSAFGEPSTNYTEQEVEVPEGCYWMGVNSYVKKTSLSIQKEISKDTYEWLGTAAIYFMETGANIEIDHCNFMNVSREAIYCSGNYENVHVHNCTFNDVSANFWSRRGNMTNFIFENNTSNRCRTMAVEFDTENGYQAKNLLIKNNRFTDIVKSAVTLTNCHDVVVEGNYYSYFDAKNEVYSEYMGEINAAPYFVWVQTDYVNNTEPDRDNCSNVVIRNNRGIVNRAVNIQPGSRTTVNGEAYTTNDVFFKDIEIYYNDFEVDSCIVRTNCVKGVTVRDNYIRGKVVDGIVWYGSGSEINEFNNIINSANNNYASEEYVTTAIQNALEVVENGTY